MACDIHGWVECTSDTAEWLIANGQAGAEPVERWRGVLDIGLVVLGRNYDMFGCLFGVRNRARFSPIAPGRGRPPDPSAVVRGAFAQVDALEREWGHAEFHSYTWITGAELLAVDWHELSSVPVGHVRGHMAGPGGELVELRGPISRMDARDPDWEIVFTVMRHLGEQWGHERVRLVVWFDG